MWNSNLHKALPGGVTLVLSIYAWRHKSSTKLVLFNVGIENPTNLCVTFFTQVLKSQFGNQVESGYKIQTSLCSTVSVPSDICVWEILTLNFNYSGFFCSEGGVQGVSGLWWQLVTEKMVDSWCCLFIFMINLSLAVWW